MAVKKQSFEQNMERLEEIVVRLERGECDLDESLKLFEDGAKLARECSAMLDKAEQKVTLLIDMQSGEEIPFESKEQ